MLAGIIIVVILSGILVYIILFNSSDSVKYANDNKKEINEDKRQKEKINEDKTQKENEENNLIEYSGNYITPAKFSIGLLKEGKYSSSNNCNHKVLYPINGLGPDYGWKMPKNCRCTEFVQSP